MNSISSDSALQPLTSGIFQAEHRDVQFTFEIDDDLAPLIDQMARSTGSSFERTVNRLLRLGLSFSFADSGDQPSVISPLPIGLTSGQNHGRTVEPLDELEGSDRP